jgi:tRNA pseudouridine13 synthase
MPVPEQTIARIINPPRMRAPVLPVAIMRSVDDDFQVEEVPSYTLTGQGEHAWLWLEKRGLSSPQMISLLSRELRIRGGEIGLAGQKDRWAVTRQFVSVPGRCVEAAAAINLPQLKVLSVTLHRNKLKTGHLKGNRFIITLRVPQGFAEADCVVVRERLQLLQAEGFPNYYGPQRFGRDGRTLNDGLRLLQGRLPRDYWPEDQSRTLKRLSLSAVQSAVFNLTTAARVESGTAGIPQVGDVVIRRGGIKPFVLPPGQPGTDFLPAGPMPGPEMTVASGDVLLQEQSAMQLLGLHAGVFSRFAKLTSGARRRMLEFPEQVVVEAVDGAMKLSFSLPSGTFATSLLAELTGDLQDAGGVETDERPADGESDRADAADRD